MASNEAKMEQDNEHSPIKFYAVAIGRQVGIFLQWSQAHASTDKFSRNRHQAFECLSDATTFLESAGIPVDSILVHVPESEGSSTSILLSDFDVNDIIFDNDFVDFEDALPASTDIIGYTCSTDTHSSASVDMVFPVNPDNIGSSVQNLSSIDKTDGDDSAVHSCRMCHLPDNDHMIRCSECATWVHYECTQLPAYSLSMYSKTNRKYSCANCVVLDADILVYLTDTSKNSCSAVHVQTEFQSVPSCSIDTQTDVADTSNQGSQCDPLSKEDSSKSSHCSCLQAVRELEKSLVERLCGTMAENYELKLKLVHKDLANILLMIGCRKPTILSKRN
jgi:hypothetical protein